MTVFLIPIAFVALFLFLLRQLTCFQVHGLPGKYLQILFLIKSLTGIIITYIAIHFLEPSDMLGYFSSGQKIFQLVKSDPILFAKIFIGIDHSTAEPFLNTVGGWYVYAWDLGLNENRMMIRLNALISFLSNGNIYVHAVFFAFLSTLGMLLLLKSVSTILNKKTIVFAAIGMTFAPGLLCWSSVVSKESLVVFLIGALIYSYQTYLQNLRKYQNALLLLAIIFIFANSRLYLLFLLLPSLVAWTYCHFRRVKKIGVVFLISHFVFASALIVAGEINPRYDPTWIIYQRQMTFMHYVDEVKPNTRIILPAPEYTYPNLIQRIPGAFLNPLIHPKFQELKNVFLIPFFIENVLLILLILYMIYRFRNVNGSSLNWTAFWFFAGLFILIGLTIPLSGLLIRLRVPALLLIIFPIAQVLTRSGNPLAVESRKRE